MMTKKEFQECEYVRDNMKFYTYEDFCKNKLIIKKMYDKLEYKTFYKWYVYSHCNISWTLLDEIWIFLNNPSIGVKDNED